MTTVPTAIYPEFLSAFLVVGLLLSAAFTFLAFVVGVVRKQLEEGHPEYEPWLAVLARIRLAALAAGFLGALLGVAVVAVYWVAARP